MTRVAIDAPSAIVQAGIEALLRPYAEIQVVDSGADVVVALVESAGELSLGSTAPTVVLIDDAGQGLLRIAGVRGVLSSDCSGEELAAAIQAAAAGLVVLHPRELAALPLAEMRMPRGVEELTPRETEIVTLLADGLSNKEIAGRLKISDHTVKFHVASVLAKLGVSTRTEAVTAALRQGLIPL